MRDPVRGPFEATLAGRTVIVPTSELAVLLADAVDRMHLEAGHTVWETPRIHHFDDWLRRCYEERQLTDATLPRVLSEFEERELWRAVIEGSEAGRDYLELEGAARAARRARRTMQDHGIPPAALSHYATDETLALRDWSAAFEARCHELRCIPADRLLAGATRPDSRDLVWLDSPSWRPAALRWLEANGGRKLMAEPAGGAATVRRLAAPSPAVELAAVADWVRTEREIHADFRAWILIPDLPARRAEVLDAFDAALVPQRLVLATADIDAPYALAGGTPLADYSAVQAALTCLAATVGAVAFDEFSRLLRMPQLQAGAADAVAAAVLDVAVRDCGPSEAPLDEWLRIAERAARGLSVANALQRLRQFLAALEGPRGVHSLSRWVSVWVRAFELGPWSSKERWSSAEFQSVERFRALLLSLATADAVFGPLSPGAAVRLLQRAARDTAFQPQTGVPPVWVSAQLMDPWLTYDGIWIAGCGEDRWPPAADPAPLLPVRLQREYGVIAASADGQLAAALDLQARWLERGRRIVFSCAAAVDGRAAVVSPLLPDAAELSGSDVRVRPHWHGSLQRAPHFDSLNDDAAPAFGVEERLRGVATLRAQSRCPFRGFAETRLAADGLQRPVPGFNGRERGNLLHDVLEDVWGRLRTSARLTSLPRSERMELLGAAVSRALATQCARRDPGAQWRRREALRLEQLVDKWLDTELQRAAFEVESIEADAAVARHGGLEFKVRVDRCDRLADGGRVLIDYKTGHALADWRGERPDNPQLPIYALLDPAHLVAVAYGKVNAAECGFVAETATGGIFKPGGRPSALEGLSDFAALVEVWSQRVERIAAEFAVGHAAVTPTRQACRSCHLQPLCRVPAALDEVAGVDE